MAFDRSQLETVAINNRGEAPVGSIGNFAGGDTAWIVDLRAGASVLDHFGKWATGINYRYVASDAVLDALTESDFGGGGTNVRGYSIYGIMALSPQVSVGLKWMSSREVAGPPLRQDTLMIDVNGSF